jgi:hypothetical protein
MSKNIISIPFHIKKPPVKGGLHREVEEKQVNSRLSDKSVESLLSVKTLWCTKKAAVKCDQNHFTAAFGYGMI